MMNQLHKTLGFLLQRTGLDKVLSSAEYKDKRLFKTNVLLGNQKLLFWICGGITFAILLCLNIAGQILLNLGKIIQGKISSLVLFLPSFKLVGLYILGLLISFIVCIYVCIKLRINFGELNAGQKGDSRFLTQSEIKDRFVEISYKTEYFPGWGGMPLYRINDKAFIDPTPVNNITYGITRSGKGETLIIPTIDIVSRAEHKASLIIPDIKGELSKACIPHLADRGYAIYMFDLYHPEKSNFYDLMHIMKQMYLTGDIDTTEELASSLANALIVEGSSVKDKFWIDAPRALFAAIVLALIEDTHKEKKIEKANLFSAFTLLASLGSISDEKEKENKLDKFFLDRSILNPARLAYTTIEFSEGKTRSSLLSVTIAALDAYRRSKVAKLTSRNDLDLTDLGFGEKPVAVFLRVPSYEKSYDGIISTFINQAYRANMLKAEQETSNKFPRRIRLIGDEIFNFPRIDGFEGMLSVGLGSGWSNDLYAQSTAQPKQVYGENIDKILTDNCGTVYFLASPDKDTREKISELCGKITIENATRSGERFSLSKTVTEQFEERPLVPAHELLHFQDGEMVIIPTMHRRNLEREKVSARPIHTGKENSLLFRHEYLPEFDTDAPIPYGRLSIDFSIFPSIDLNDLIYTPPTLTVSKTMKETMMSDLLSTSELSFISQNLPNSFLFDYATVNKNEFKDILENLYGAGEISDKEYATISKLLTTKA